MSTSNDCTTEPNGVRTAACAATARAMWRRCTRSSNRPFACSVSNTWAMADLVILWFASSPKHDMTSPECPRLPMASIRGSVMCYQIHTYMTDTHMIHCRHGTHFHTCETHTVFGYDIELQYVALNSGLCGVATQSLLHDTTQI